MAEKSTSKRLPLIIGVVLVVAVVVMLIIFIPMILDMQNNQEPSSQVVDPPEQSPKEEEDQLYAWLEENQDLMDTISCFYYPESEIQAIQMVGPEEDFLYIELNSVADFKQVHDYYQNKQVQSIWSQSESFESSTLSLEEEFLDDNSSAEIAKFTYNSDQRDKVVNVLISSLQENQTEIMVIYWEL